MATLSIRDLAEALDVSPADALDIALQNGVQRFWHEGEQVSSPWSGIVEYLHSRERMHDPTPDLEFDSTPALDNHLWRFEAEQLLSEAAVEIANLSSPENIVCRRLRGLLKQVLVNPAKTKQELVATFDWNWIWSR